MFSACVIRLACSLLHRFFFHFSFYEWHMLLYCAVNDLAKAVSFSLNVDAGVECCFSEAKPEPEHSYAEYCL